MKKRILQEKLIMDWYGNEDNLVYYYNILSGTSVKGRNIQAYNILKGLCIV